MTLPVMPSTHRWFRGGPGLSKVGRNALFASDDTSVWVWDEETGNPVTDLRDETGAAVSAPRLSDGWLLGAGLPNAVRVASFSLGKNGKRYEMIPVQTLVDASTAMGPTSSAVDAVVGNDRIVYVSTGGNDSASGKAWGSAKATIAGALAALGGNPGKVMVGRGTYTFSTQINLDSSTGVTIEGVGGMSGGSAPATILSYSGTGTASAISALHSSALTIRNLMLLYTSSSFTGRLIDARNPTPRGSDTAFLTLEDCYLGGASGIRTADALLDLDGSHSTNLIRCSFLDSVNGVRGQAASGSYANIVLMERCYFRNQTQAAIRNPGDGWAVVGCTWEPLSTGAAGAVKCDSGVLTNGFTVLGGWAGDIVASAGGVQFDLSGNNLSIEGTTIGGNTGSTGVKIRNSANGVRIAAVFNGCTNAIDVSGVIPKNYDFSRSHFIAVTTPLTAGYVVMSLDGISGAAAPQMLVQNTGATDGRAVVRYKADRTSSQQWDLGVDPAGGVSKRFQLRDLTASGSPIRWQVTPTGSVISGASAPATTATDGFSYIPVMAGTPTGTPTAETGYAPMVVDSAGSKLWVYIGGAWKSTTLA